MKFSAVIPINEKNTKFLDDLKNKISDIEIICVTDKNYDVEHPIIKQKQSDVIFRTFFDICQKVINKIKV